MARTATHASVRAIYTVSCSDVRKVVGSCELLMYHTATVDNSYSDSVGYLNTMFLPNEWS
jgi:hypothetical protein